MNESAENSSAPIEARPMKITVIIPKRDKLDHHLNHFEELYSLFLEPLFKDSRFTNVYSYKMFGNSLCEVYSKMLDSLFIIYKRKHILSYGTTRTLRTVLRTLPRCFAVTAQCHVEADVLFGIANIAFQALFAEQNTLETIYIIPSIYSTCLEIGLLIKEFSKKDTVEFSHQQFVEFLAALYIAMCTEDEREKELCLLYSFCVSSESSLLLSQLLVFMSGMCPDVVGAILRFVADIVSNEKHTYLYRNNGSLTSRCSEYIEMFHNLQDLVIMCAQECRANKCKDIAFSEFSLQDIIIANSRSYDRCLLSSLIEHNSNNIKSVFIEETSPEHLDVLIPALLQCHYLQTIVISCALIRRQYVAILQLLQHNINLKYIWLNQVKSDQADSDSNNDNSENTNLELNLSNHMQLKSLHIRAAICIFISEANVINLNNFCVDMTQWTPYDCSHMLTCLTKASKLQTLELNCIPVEAELLRSIVHSVSCHQHSVSVNLSNCSIKPNDRYLSLIREMLASNKFVMSQSKPLCFKFKTKGTMTQNYVPSRPMEATFTNKTSDGLMLEWKKPINDGGDEIEGYYVLQKVNACGWKEIATLAPYTTKYQIKGLKSDVCYTFAVAAENKVGRSDPIVTNNFKYTRLKKTVPSSPIGPVKILDNKANSFLISWQPSHCGSALSRYYIEIQEASNSTWSFLAEVQPCVTSYNVQKLKIHKEYFFRIFAQNRVGISDALVSEGVTGKSSDHIESPETCKTKFKITQFNGLKEELFGYMINTRAKLSSTPMFKDRRFKKVFKSILLDDSMCTVYSMLIDAMFKHSKMKTSTTITTLTRKPIFRQLPHCFGVTDTCQSQYELLLHVANLAFNLLFVEQQKPMLIIPKSVTDKLLSKSVFSTCLKIGLLDVVDTNNVKFPCKSMQEFLAALYFSMCNMTERDNALGTLNSCCTSIDTILNMSQVLQFMCGMCPKIVSLLSATIHNIVSNDWKTEKYRTEKVHRLIIDEPLAKTLTDTCNNEVDRMVMEKATFWNYLEIFYNLQRMNIVCAQESIANMYDSFAICLQDIVVINNKTMDTLMLKILIEQQPNFIRSVLLYKSSNEQCDSLLMALLNCQKLQTFRSKDCNLNPKQVSDYRTIIELNTDLAYVWLDQCKTYSCVDCSELLSCLKTAAKLQSLKLKGVLLTVSYLGSFFDLLSNRNYCTNVTLFGCEIVPFEDYQGLLNMIKNLPRIAISNVDPNNFCCSITTTSNSQPRYTKNNLCSDKTKLDSNQDYKTEVAVKTNTAKPSVQKRDTDTLFVQKGISLKGKVHPSNVNANKNSTSQKVKSVANQKKLTTISKKNLPKVKKLKGAYGMNVNVDVQKAQNRKAALGTNSCEKHLNQVPLVNDAATVNKKANKRKKAGRQQRRNKVTIDITKEAHNSPYLVYYEVDRDSSGSHLYKLYKLSTGTHFDEPAFSSIFSHNEYGKSLCEVYSKMLESLLVVSNETHVASAMATESTLHAGQRTLPRCFEGYDRCNFECEFLHDIATVAFQTVTGYLEPKLMLVDTIKDLLSPQGYAKCLQVRLLTESLLHIGHVQFPSKLMQQFLAALYLSMCNTDEKEKALRVVHSCCGSLKSLLKMSQLFLFMSGMCPDVVSSMAHQIADIVNCEQYTHKHRTCNSYVDIFHYLQDMLKLCANESMVHNNETVILPLQDIVIMASDFDDLAGLPTLIEQNQCNIKSLYYQPSTNKSNALLQYLLKCQHLVKIDSSNISTHKQCYTIFQLLQQNKEIRYVNLKNIHITDKYHAVKLDEDDSNDWSLDLSGHSQLTSIDLYDTCIQITAINTTNLEHLHISVDETSWFDCSDLLRNFTTNCKLHSLLLENCLLDSSSLYSLLEAILQCEHSVSMHLRDCTVTPVKEYNRLMEEIKISPRICVSLINNDELIFKTLWNIQRSIVAENTNGRNNTIEELSASADINSNEESIPPQKPVDYSTILECNQDYHGYFKIFKESLSEVYCKIFDLFFAINSKNTTGIANVEATKDVMRNLPKCFEVTNQCKNESDLVFSMAKHTYQELFLQKQDTSTVFSNSEHRKQILASVFCNCSGTGLQMEQMDTSLHMDCKQISTEIFHEFLTAVYITMCTADEKNETLNTIFSLCRSIRSIFEMSQLFIFMSGMCPEVASSMIQHIAAVVNNEQCTLEHRTEGGWEDIFQCLQDLMVMCAQESQANNHNVIAWSLQDVVIKNSTSIDLMTLSVLIQQNQQNIKSLYYKPTNGLQVELLHVLLKCRHLQRIESECMFIQDQCNAFIELLTQNTDLRYLSLKQVQCINMVSENAISEYVLDLSKHTQIKSIQMKHTSIQIRMINTDNLECISVTMEPTFQYDCSDILTCLTKAPKLLSLTLKSCLLNCTLLCRFVVAILQNQHSVCVNLQGCIVTPVEDYQKLKEEIKTSNRFIVDHVNREQLQFTTVLLAIESDTLEHKQRYKYIFKANDHDKQEHEEFIETQLDNDFQTVLKDSRHAHLVAEGHLLDKSDPWDTSENNVD